MRTRASMISRRRLLAAAAMAVPAIGLARFASNSDDVAAASVAVNIVNFAFVPTPLTINQYDTVTWTNQDTAPHTVTSDTPGQFNSPLLQKGQSVKITFNKAGTFPYHCTVHPNMHGTVIVNPVFAAIVVPPGGSAPADFVQDPPAPADTAPVAPAAPVAPPPAAPLPAAPIAAPPPPPPPPQTTTTTAPPPAPAPKPAPPPLPAPPRTGGGGEALFVRRLGDG